MMKIKGVKIILTAVLVLAPSTAFADLEINFEQDPLFNNANFLPGDSVVRWVKAVNTGNISYELAAKVENASDPQGLASQIAFQVKRQGSGQALFDGTLKNFFEQDLLTLGTLPAGETATFEFTARFEPASGNSFQRVSAGFDIVLGTLGANQANGGGGGGSLFFTRSDPALAPVVKGVEYAFPVDLDEPAIPEGSDETPVVLGIDNINRILAPTGFSLRELLLILAVLTILLAIRYRLKRNIG